MNNTGNGNFKKSNAGRPKGSVNKVTAKAKEFLMRVNDTLESVLFDDLMTVEPSERIKLWLALQEYIMPKLSRQEITGDAAAPQQITVNLSKLSNDELEKLEQLAELARDQDGESEEEV